MQREDDHIHKTHMEDDVMVLTGHVTRATICNRYTKPQLVVLLGNIDTHTHIKANLLSETISCRPALPTRGLAENA